VAGSFAGRDGDGDLARTLQLNCERFGVSGRLADILANTAPALAMAQC
jgi:hypothetical protein